MKQEPKPTLERDTPLSSLRVIDRLEVGPVRLEADRLAMPYRVEQDGSVQETELAYRWQEQVFDPAEPASLGLASMIGAQVALNYTLFCGEIVFRGPFDEHDRRFLERMGENTAREIYVNKLLAENPFLTGAAARVAVSKQERYGQARLSFPDPPGQSAAWSSDPEKYCVLSSGGKDSLASFGLLQEIGAEVHPIFGNESGRHWFTALNAYRHFQAQVPHSGRVWMNSDRVFAWMLRRLPFVRPDFVDVRADIYPIRLWTVAVFLFGVLPLMRQRGLGNLVIGDEYDSSERATTHGIPHYAGLYDQSHYFDRALTRYFHAKGWNVRQFSILRPLSELLIQKVLVERYPGLQVHQVSCHAAHKEGERVYPCGKCEKCRRIVTMLTALGADPARCGYRPEKVDDVLRAFVQRGLHQESASVEHLTWLLSQQGLVDVAPPARPRPEVLHLRFDRIRSRLENLPRQLRRPLYSIYLEHAEGALLRRGRSWVPFDPLSAESLGQPYTFESRQRAQSGERDRLEGPEDDSRAHILAEMTWPEAKRRFEEVDIALLPVGAIEQHGPHLPLDTDSFDADHLAREVARHCSDPRPLVLPLVPYGVSYHHNDFSGTFSLTNETMARLIYEIGMSAARNGVKKLVMINGHGGNAASLNFAAQMINRDAHIFVCVDSGETSDVDVYAMTETPNDVHAGEIETSTTLALRPELVDMDQARASIPRFSSRYLDFTSKRAVSWYAYTERISPSGVMGDPTKATAEKGRRIWELMIDHLVRFVEELKDLTLEEIYQRRY